MALTSKLSSIGDAIRSKTGGSSLLTLDQMPEAIASISGDEPTLQAKGNISPTTSSQTITADAGYDGLSSVQINAMPAMTLPTQTSATSSGSKAARIWPDTSVRYINVPTGYNSQVKHYELQPMILDSTTIDHNGTYYANDADLHGFNQVVVEVEDSSFVVTLSYNSSTSMWEPDRTWAEARAAFAAGKELSLRVDGDHVIGVIADGCYNEYDSGGLTTLLYAVRKEYYQTDVYSEDFTIYVWTSNGIEIDETLTTIDPSNISTNITTNGTHNVYYDRTVNVSVPTGTARTSSDLTVSGATVTVPAGLYSTQATKSVASGSAGTPTATKGAVSNHAISVTPSVTNATGYIGGGTKTGTPVSVAASELVSGSQTITTNGTVDVTNLASVVVEVQGGGSSGVSEAWAYTELQSRSSTIAFTGLEGEPTSFTVMYDDSVSVPSGTPYNVVSVVYDGTSVHAQTLTNTSNAQVTYDASSFSKSYSNGTLTITSTGAQFIDGVWFVSYTYGGGAIDTKDVQVGSGATSITFTGLEDEPLYWSLIFKSNFSTSSGYQRVIALRKNSSNIYGFAMDSRANGTSTYWTESYSNGELTITSSGTNAGGYFHQPGYYQLTYAYDATGNYQTKTVTPTTSTQDVTADTGYDALRKVVVNPIPSQYVVPTGNIAITSNTTSGQTLDVSHYATATVSVPTGGGGGTANIDTKTVTASNRPSSLSFTGMEGEPKAFFLKATFTMTSSSSTYYYVDSIRYNGTNTQGRLFRMGSTRQTEHVTSGYSWSYSGTTLTVTSTGARSTSPGCFYNGSYELTYVY